MSTSFKGPRQNLSNGSRLCRWAALLAFWCASITVPATAAPCDGNQIFTDPDCAAIFRQINRNEALPPNSQATSASRETSPPPEHSASPIATPSAARSVPQPDREVEAGTSAGPVADTPREESADSRSRLAALQRANTQSSSPAERKPGKRGPDGLPPEPPLREPQSTYWNSIRYQEKGLTEEELIATECTRPLSDWTVIDVHQESDTRGIASTIKRDGNVLVRVHYPSNAEWRGVHDFQKVDVRGTGCVKVLGVNDPSSGERPTVRYITAKGFSGPPRERPGGLIIENIRISMGDHQEIHGPSAGGDCISWPNSARFVVIRNSVISKCQHHAFVTSRAYHQYLEIDSSHFEYAQSHLAYIDRVGFAYIHDSTFQSPGWGHALRCIAARCVIDNVHVSNVELDGTVAPEGINPKRPTQHYVGMNPIDLYMVGGEHILKNSTVDYYYVKNAGQWAAQYRARWLILGTELGPHDGKSWTYAPYWTQEWFEAQEPPVKPIDLTVSNNTFNCLNNPCYMFLVQSTYPAHTPGKTRNQILSWLKENQWADWDSMIANAPDEWVWTLSRAYDKHKKTLLSGKTVRSLPARIPLEPEWVERGVIIVKNNNTVNNSKSRPIRAPVAPTAFCWGFWIEGKEGQECQTPTRQARVVIEE